MKQLIINPAVFAYTLYTKFEDKRNLLPLLFFVIAPCTMLIIPMILPHPPLTGEGQKQMAGMITSYFTNSIVGLLTSYVFISDGPAGRKMIAESDSLSLLFTRPLTRFSYVLSKFCAGLVGTTITLSAGLMVSYLVGLCVGINQIDISPLAFASIVCNAASWTSLVVFLHCAPPLAGILTWLFLYSASGMGGIFVRAEYSNDHFVEMLKTVCLFIYRWFGDILPVPIYLPDLLSAASFDIYEAAIYFSNISLLLLFASYAMARREFSYGSD